jgi:hypothetical protein
VRRAWLAVVGGALGAALAVPLLGAPAPVSAGAVSAATASAGAASVGSGSAVRHVVIVGISGLRWNQVTASATPELWRLAEGGSVGSLVDYAQQPLACSADGWLTLNAAARAQGPRPCAPLPAVVPVGRGATVPAMPQIIAANRGFNESPDWGLLGSLAGCATAVGPGAALALASPTGTVDSYLPAAGELSPVVLARCPLTVIDLGQTQGTERTAAAALDRQLARIAADLPAGSLLLVTAPGAAAGPRSGGAPIGPPHLMTVVVSGPGYADGLLASASTRRPGIVTLTDLTPTVAGWLGRAVPAGTVGARIGRTSRGELPATIAALLDRDTAEQVWLATHGWFFAGYAAADALAFGLPALIFWGAAEDRRRARARCWRVAGALAASVPLGSYLAPWWQWAHPAWWLYGLAVAGSLAVAGLALGGSWWRGPRISGAGGSGLRAGGAPGAPEKGRPAPKPPSPRPRRPPSGLGPSGAICLATLMVLAIDAISGSRLQLEAPFGLSLLVSGRYYGIGNDVLGVYCVSALAAAAWLGCALPRPRLPRPRRPRFPVLAAASVGVFAVIALGWPGFGAKVGGTIALVPCLALLLIALAGSAESPAGAGEAGRGGALFRVGWRWAVPIAVSGIALFALFALISYFVPAAGVSDLGTFAGNLLHGRAGGVLERKASSNVGTLTVSAVRWLIPVAAVAAAAALWRPSALRLRTLPRAFEAAPVLRAVAWLCWLALVIGWLADDSGVIVPAAALPFAVPLMVSAAVAVSAAADGGRYLGSASTARCAAGSGAGGALPPKYDQPQPPR